MKLLVESMHILELGCFIEKKREIRSVQLPATAAARKMSSF